MSTRDQKSIINRINRLNALYSTEAVRVEQKRMALYAVENRLRELAPLVREYEILSMFPSPGSAQRVRALQQNIREYNMLKSRAEYLRSEIAREEMELLSIRNEISKLHWMLTEEMAGMPLAPAATPGTVVTPSYAEEYERLMREIRRLEQLLTRAYREGRINEAQAIQARLEELYRRLRQLGGASP